MNWKKKLLAIIKRYPFYRTRIVLRTVKHRIFSTRIEPITDLCIETTTYCNRKCSYCPNSVFERGLRKNEHLMAPALFRKIVDELADIGFKGRLYPHLFGEPLTDSRLISFMHYVHVRLPKARPIIFTNGDFLTPTLLDKLYAVGVRDFVITLHSTDDASLTYGVDRVKQLKKHAKDQNKDISLQCQAHLDERQLFNRGGLVEVDQVVSPWPPRWLTRPNYCYADSPVSINYRGDVVICCNDYLGQVVFGNLCDESLKDIWSKSEFVKIRRQLERGVYTLDICKKCTSTGSEWVTTAL